MKIGELAEKLHLSTDTIRFYEKEKLIPSPKRTSGGYRNYDESYLDTIQTILRLKSLGFSLDEIKSLVSENRKPLSCCDGVKNRVNQKLTEIKEAIRKLEHQKKLLEGVCQSCGGVHMDNGCLILNKEKGRTCKDPR